MKAIEIKGMISAIVLLSIIIFFSTENSRASTLISVRDLLSTSKPGAGSDHSIRFKATHAIPPGGKITITPESNYFNIPGTFDYTDIDVAVSSMQEIGYVDREISSSADNSYDGASVLSGVQGNITITLNSVDGIGQNEFVKISLGTNAVYGDYGNEQIINPISNGSYRINIKTYNSADILLDNSETYIAIVSQVGISAWQPKVRANGQPSGVLLYGTTMSILSLTTNYLADCRFSTATDTPYELMTNSFEFTGANYHSYTLTGLINGQTYTYYVRCFDSVLLEADLTDYIITFSIQVAGSGQVEDPDSGTGGGSGGASGGSTGGGAASSGGGGGGGGGGSGTTGGTNTGDQMPYPEPLANPDLYLAGLAYPGSQVYIIKDGKVEKTIKSNSLAEFNAEIGGLSEGVYTFGVRSSDSAGLSSPVSNFTFWVKKGTKTNVSDIFLAPTISINKNQVSPGESIKSSGQTVPNSTVEVWFYSNTIKVPSSSNVKISKGMADSFGKWSIIIDTEGDTNGTYNIKARSIINSFKLSDFSRTLSCGVGGGGSDDNCKRSDLNNDGKVNLVDFSILLYNWGKSGPNGDINRDGTVNLVDFSLMMYCWTG